MSKKVKRLTAKTQEQHRQELAKRQNYKCYLCGHDLKKLKTQQWHLDHDHDNGNCRTILCSVCNGKEGAVKNRVHVVVNWSKTGMTPSEYLRKLADYWEQDFSEEPIHESHAREQIRRFKRLNAKQQCALLTEQDIEPESNTDKRAKQARKLLKEGKIWL